MTLYQHGHIHEAIYHFKNTEEEEEKNGFKIQSIFRINAVNIFSYSLKKKK